MRRKIFIQSFIIATITALIVFFASVGTHYWVSERKITQDIIEDSAILSDMLQDDMDIVNKVSDFGNMRVTLVARDGHVIFDSWKGDSANMDNHLEREEVISALNGSPKVVKRYSDTLGASMYYYAETVGGEDGFILRVAERASNIWSFTGMGILYVLIATLVAYIISFVLAKKLSDKVEKQLVVLRDGLRNCNNGDFSPMQYDDSDSLNMSILSEMNELMDTLQRNYNALETEKNKLSTVVSNMTQGIILLDKEDKLILLNKVSTEIFGEGNIGDNIICFISDIALHDRIISALRGDGDIFNYTLHDRDLLIHAWSMNDDRGDRLGIVLIADVTIEREVSRQKSLFFTNASHELKTPLTSMRGLSEILLSRTQADDPNYKYIKRIYTESMRLHSIVMDMLYISKLESRDLSVNNTDINLASMCNDAIEQYHDEIESKHISVQLSGEADIYADERNIYEAINNVIGNAVHYNVDGGSISIDLAKNGDSVSVTVKDTGIGIPREHLPKVCERFYRVDKSRSKLTGGTGLGLSIVKYVVALYNGTLNIDSTVGSGTTVTMTFKSL